MAEATFAQIVGAFEVGIGYADLSDGREGRATLLKRWDTSMGSPGHDRMHVYPSSFFMWPHYVITDANNNTKASVKATLPWPIEIYAIDVGCESAAGSAGTVDCFVEGTTILDAPEDVKTGAGTGQRVVPEAGSTEVDFGQTFHITQIGTGSGAMIGGQAQVYCQRR